MIIDANQLDAQIDIDTDVCIVGAGAAGIVLANELNQTSTDVCLIESGHEQPTEAGQALYDVENIGYPIRENFMSRARYYGGTCNIWAGRSMKLSPIDLQKRDWVPNSGWPLSYAELDTYYKRASDILRLPSVDSLQALSQRYQLSPQECSIFEPADFEPAVVSWAKRPMRFGPTYRSTLKKSRNIRVYLNANVTEIVLNDAGRAVTSFAVQTWSGKRFRVNAKRFVLACGGLENARLLLVSRQQQAHGIGNDFDAVGRYFMDHPRAIFGRLRLFEPARLYSLLGLPLADGKFQLGIALSEAAQRREQVLHSYISLEPQLSEMAKQQYQSSVHLAKIVLRKGYAGSRFRLFNSGLAEVQDLIYLLTPREIMPHALYRFCVNLKRKIQASSGPQELSIINYCEQVPDVNSRVFLSEKRDRLNMNSLVLDWKMGTQETESLIRLHELLNQHLVKSGIGEIEHTRADMATLPFTDASHHMGTTRMSEDPRTGVVDPNCKLHRVENLFMAGSSVFPTVGHANPTLTIVALSLRPRRLSENHDGVARCVSVWG